MSGFCYKGAQFNPYKCVETQKKSFRLSTKSRLPISCTTKPSDIESRVFIAEWQRADGSDKQSFYRSYPPLPFHPVHFYTPPPQYSYHQGQSRQEKHSLCAPVTKKRRIGERQAEAAREDRNRTRRKAWSPFCISSPRHSIPSSLLHHASIVAAKVGLLLLLNADDRS